MLELSRVYTWLRQWSYTGVLRERSHVAAFTVRLFSAPSWEFHRQWLKTLTGSRSYEMQQTWQRITISLTAFFLLLFNLVKVAGCGSLLKVPWNCSRWVEPTLPTHLKQEKNKNSVSVLLTVKKKKKHPKTLPALPKQQCRFNTLLWSLNKMSDLGESAVTRSTCKGVTKAIMFHNSWTIAFYSQ